MTAKNVQGRLWLLKDRGERTPYYHFKSIKNFQYFGMEWDIWDIYEIYIIQIHLHNLQIQEKYFAGFALSLHCETFPFHRGSPSLSSKLAMIHIIGTASALQKYEICIFEPAPYLYIFPWSNVALYVKKIWKYFFIVIHLPPPVWLISKINWFNGFDVDFDVYDKFDLNCDHKNNQILFLLLNISRQEKTF